ncbi:hypothetical protein BX666DRAFT_1930419 [Dichotomocladium elegans]|nr:hypothetical protein BX666DRAFT_1930419 [Dichotomocladium elegans]
MSYSAPPGSPLDRITDAFSITADKFESIVQGFKAECDHGLRTASATGLASMIPSFVTRMPTGQETGTCLSLDLGGSNLRVSLVQLLGQGKSRVTEVRREITPEWKTSSVDTFFDRITEAIHELIGGMGNQASEANAATSRQRRRRRPMPMGVCWSFPLNQTGISRGTILRMGKGFAVDSIEGQDLANLFHKAFKRRKLNVVVTALLNDTVGTLVAHAYGHPGTCMGFIYGTGVNAAYPEKVSRIAKLKNIQQQWPGKGDDAHRIMLVNTEIDIFGSESYLPLTRFDKLLDAQHPQPAFQIYEKMMSGAYLGELVRLIMIELAKEHQMIFGGRVPATFLEPWTLSTEFMSDFVRLSTNEERLENFRNIVHAKGEATTDDANYVSLQDMERIVEICHLVSSRAAALAAAAMAAIIEHQGLTDEENQSKPIVIGVNGSTYEKYPGMPDMIYAQLRSWFGEEVATSRIKLALAKDGGSVGGALIAMLYSSDRRLDTITPDKVDFL